MLTRTTGQPSSLDNKCSKVGGPSTFAVDKRNKWASRGPSDLIASAAYDQNSVTHGRVNVEPGGNIQLLKPTMEVISNYRIVFSSVTKKTTTANVLL